MSRRAVPPIAPTDLRDHADAERVDRVWQRIERDLVVTDQPASSRGRSRGVWALAIAASLAAFGGGLLVGRQTLGDRDAGVTTPTPSPDRVAVEILAAGDEKRTLPLPGLGEITLSAGSTVEVERSSATSLTLKLVQGEASVDIGAAPKDKSLEIRAGEATLSAQAGSIVRVRRSSDHMAVNVDAGSARLSSPAGIRDLSRGQGEESIPLHHPTATLSPPNALHGPRAPLVVASTDVAPTDPPAAQVAGPPDWLSLANASRHKEAFEQLKLQPGGVQGAIEAAKTSTELMKMGDVSRAGGDSDAAILAWTRLLERFPGDQNAEFAAYYLGDVFEKKGKPEKAKEYLARVQSSTLAEDAQCRRLRIAARQGHKDEAAALATEYVKKHPNGGVCKADAERILGGEEEHEEAVPKPASGQPDAAP